MLLLDEVGLAEFSPAAGLSWRHGPWHLQLPLEPQYYLNSPGSKDMPLKVLHGILAEPGIVSVVGFWQLRSWGRGQGWLHVRLLSDKRSHR